MVGRRARTWLWAKEVINLHVEIADWNFKTLLFLGPCVAILVYTAQLVKPGRLKFTYQYADDSVLFQFQVSQPTPVHIFWSDANLLTTNSSFLGE